MDKIDWNEVIQHCDLMAQKGPVTADWTQEGEKIKLSLNFTDNSGRYVIQTGRSFNLMQADLPGWTSPVDDYATGVATYDPATKCFVGQEYFGREIITKKGIRTFAMQVRLPANLTWQKLHMDICMLEADFEGGEEAQQTELNNALSRILKGIEDAYVAAFVPLRTYTVENGDVLESEYISYDPDCCDLTPADFIKEGDELVCDVFLRVKIVAGYEWMRDKGRPIVIDLKELAA